MLNLNTLEFLRTYDIFIEDKSYFLNLNLSQLLYLVNLKTLQLP